MSKRELAEKELQELIQLNKTAKEEEEETRRAMEAAAAAEEGKKLQVVARDLSLLGSFIEIRNGTDGGQVSNVAGMPVTSSGGNGSLILEQVSS